MVYSFNVCGKDVTVHATSVVGHSAVDLSACCDGQTVNARHTVAASIDSTLEQVQAAIEKHARELAEQAVAKANSRRLIDSILA